MTAAQTIYCSVPGHTIGLRPIAPADRAFLCSVYAGTRAEELALVQWSDAQKQAFVAMQFDAQHSYYQQHYPRASFDLLLLDGQPIGRLYVARHSSEIRIVDIAIVPAYRGQGIGSAVLAALLAEGARAGLPVTIHVERFNRALRLYERLGFRQIEDKGVYLLMECLPGKARDAA